MPEEQNEAEKMIEVMVARMAEVVPTKLVAPENRLPLAESFIEMLGRLVEFLEKFHPLNHGQAAALLYFVGNLKLDKVGEDAGFIMLAMVEAAKKAAPRMKKTASLPKSA